MTDNGLAELAAALAPLLPQHQEGSGGYPYQSSHRTWTVYDFMPPDTLAAAILGPHGVFLPDGHPLGVEDAIAQGQQMLAERDATIATLRAALDDRDATILRQHDCDHSECIDNADALRAALDGLVAAAQMAVPALAYGAPVQAAAGLGDPEPAFRAALAAAKEAGG